MEDRRISHLYRCQAGLSLLELVMAIVIAGILGAVSFGALNVYGSGNRLKNEASELVESLWELRGLAITGRASPCIDFPSDRKYRLFIDHQDPRDGYSAGGGDELLREVTMKGGLKIVSAEGGASPNNYVCFEARGVIGSANQPLRVLMGIDGGKETKLVELLPSTGMAKVN